MKGKFDFAKLQNQLGKYKYVAIILCLGVVLMLWPTRSQEDTQNQAETQSARQTDLQNFDLEELERRMETALSEINGVGEATVVLTLRSGGEDVLAQDTSEGSTSDRETVIISTGSGTEEAVSVKTIYPEFQGALVICNGAGNAGVKLEVLQAVSAITGLSSDQISICQRKWGCASWKSGKETRSWRPLSCSSAWRSI